MSILKTAERNTEGKASNNIITQRHFIAYEEAARLVSGDILEIGCGEGYGMKYLCPKVDNYFGIDKFSTQVDAELNEKYNISFKQMNIPPLSGFEDNSFDFVISFQVIEHINDDLAYLKEIHRVLKKGGKFIVTTPNISMSLTRNPWHIREYTTSQFNALLKKIFNNVEVNGVFGKEKATKYYQENKLSVERFTKYDFLNLQYKLPRWMLKIPYDLFNNISRKWLYNRNQNIIEDFTTDDFYIDVADENSYDLFAISTK